MMPNRGTRRDAGGTKRQQNNYEIEVLFEYQGHRSVIKSKRSQLLDKITQNLICVGGLPQSSTSAQSDMAEVHTLQSSRQARGKERNYYLLQRYVKDWKTYINVDVPSHTRIFPIRVWAAHTRMGNFS